MTFPRDDEWAKRAIQACANMRHPEALPDMLEAVADCLDELTENGLILAGDPAADNLAKSAEALGLDATEANDN